MTGQRESEQAQSPALCVGALQWVIKIQDWRGARQATSKQSPLYSKGVQAGPLDLSEPQSPHLHSGNGSVCLTCCCFFPTSGMMLTSP